MFEPKDDFRDDCVKIGIKDTTVDDKDNFRGVYFYTITALEGIIRSIGKTFGVMVSVKKYDTKKLRTLGIETFISGFEEGLKIGNEINKVREQKAINKFAEGLVAN